MLNSIYGFAVMDMDYSYGYFTHAIDKYNENNLFENWKLQYPHMTEETFISFEDYKSQALQKCRKTTHISYSDIENEMEMIEQTFKGRR